MNYRRRTQHVRLGIGALAALFVIALVAAVGRDRYLSAHTNFDEMVQRFSIEIDAPRQPPRSETPWGVVAANPASRWEIARYASILRDELGRYPDDLAATVRLSRIVLVRDLTYANQRRSAIPDWFHDVLYVDVARGAFDRLYQRRVFHHELFHLIDYRDDGLIYRDASWSALNPPDFTYQGGGLNLQDDATASLLSSAWPGFLNRYSLQGVEEDKAEVFAFLMVEPQRLRERAEQDPIISAKIEQLKQMLRDFWPAFEFLTE